MPKHSFAFVHFGAELDATLADWYAEAYYQVRSHPAIGAVQRAHLVGTPVTALRNKAVAVSRAHGDDFLLMFDNDMRPDLYAGPSFLSVALPWLLQHRGAVIAAPYCMGPPEEKVNVFEWVNEQDQLVEPGPEFYLRAVDRADAATRAGIQEVAALGTGLILYDLRAFDKLSHPYYRYEFSDETQADVVATEDVVCSRNMSIAGVQQCVAWDCWAGHRKTKLVGKPCPPTIDQVRGIVRGLVNGKALVGGSNDVVRGSVNCKQDASSDSRGIVAHAKDQRDQSRFVLRD